MSGGSGIKLAVKEPWLTDIMLSGNTTMDKLGARDVAVASSVSKIFASTLTYPHEVSKDMLLILIF